MSIPNDRKYSETHEWYLVSGDVVTLGVTQFAADELTDVTYVELPAVGARVKAGQPCGQLESVKATSDLLCAVDGEVLERNDWLADHPEKVNEDAFGAAWMLKLRVKNLAPLAGLMDPAAYAKHIAES
jgi:glycine cleavage system H protein